MNPSEKTSALVEKLSNAFGSPEPRRRSLRLREEAQYLLDLADRIDQGANFTEESEVEPLFAFHPQDGRAAYALDEVLDRARHVLEVTHRRSRIFGSDTFNDPRWNIVLSAFVAALEGRTVTASDLCEASNVPYPACLGHLDNLMEIGFLFREVDENPPRTEVISLQAEIILKIVRFFMHDRSSNGGERFFWPVQLPAKWPS